MRHALVKLAGCVRTGEGDANMRRRWRNEWGQDERLENTRKKNTRKWEDLSRTVVSEWVVGLSLKVSVLVSVFVSFLLFNVMFKHSTRGSSTGMYIKKTSRYKDCFLDLMCLKKKKKTTSAYSTAVIHYCRGCISFTERKHLISIHFWIETWRECPHLAMPSFIHLCFCYSENLIMQAGLFEDFERFIAHKTQ